MVAVITGFFSFAGIIYANFASKKRTELKATVTEVKTEALAKAEIVKIQTEAETKRIDQTQKILLDSMERMEKRIKDLEDFAVGCIEDRRKFTILDAEKDVKLLKLQALHDTLKAQYDALEAQFRNVKAFNELSEQDKVVVDGRSGV